jgi:hypothetical protein
MHFEQRSRRMRCHRGESVGLHPITIALRNLAVDAVGRDQRYCMNCLPEGARAKKRDARRAVDAAFAIPAAAGAAVGVKQTGSRGMRDARRGTCPRAGSRRAGVRHSLTNTMTLFTFWP